MRAAFEIPPPPVLTVVKSAGPHTVCFDGSALVSGCDNPPVNPSCVAAICANDAFCCNTEWDGICVSEVPIYCGKNCN
ncbi:MAG TPA: hypothetical protein VFO11_13475 [Candidatus Polarisedimenticolaceae bacterium]|nr:hypothetical protein [Candidatus Polarisedimenticolaceae bacterium]